MFYENVAYSSGLGLREVHGILLQQMTTFCKVDLEI